MRGEPALSVVLAADRFETARTMVDHLRAQSARSRIELVLVTPRDTQIDAAQLHGFGGVRSVDVDSLVPLGAARAAGVVAATAPVVFIAETHAYPSPACADALIAAHEEGWAAVAPVIANANPTGALSWAGLLLDYGSWLDGPRREIDLPPAYNAAFKRRLLLDRADDLAELLEPGSDVFRRLRAEGHRFLHEPTAHVEHLNVTIPRHWLRERFLVGRLVASRRRASWSWPRRLLYCAGSPLLPLIFALRVRHNVRAAARREAFPWLTYPAIGLGAAAWALGELIGYAVGTSERTEQDLVEYELHKSAYVTGPVE